MESIHHTKKKSYGSIAIVSSNKLFKKISFPIEFLKVHPIYTLVNTLELLQMRPYITNILYKDWGILENNKIAQL